MDVEVALVCGAPPLIVRTLFVDDVPPLSPVTSMPPVPVVLVKEDVLVIVDDAALVLVDTLALPRVSTRATVWAPAMAPVPAVPRPMKTRPASAIAEPTRRGRCRSPLGPL